MGMAQTELFAHLPNSDSRFRKLSGQTSLTVVLLVIIPFKNLVRRRVAHLRGDGDAVWCAFSHRVGAIRAKPVGKRYAAIEVRMHEIWRFGWFERLLLAEVLEAG
jgi:hypothetical protein